MNILFVVGLILHILAIPLILLANESREGQRGAPTLQTHGIVLVLLSAGLLIGGRLFAGQRGAWFLVPVTVTLLVFAFFIGTAQFD